jgi:hypothetical protein
MEIARPTPTQRERAVRLLPHEAGGDETANALAAAAERMCEPLSAHLGTSLGLDTFYALLARALALVKTDLLKGYQGLIAGIPTPLEGRRPDDDNR